MGREESASHAEPLPASPWKQFALDVGRRVRPIVIHGITTIVAILFMALCGAILDLALGHDALFYRRFPVRYWIETGEILMLTRFVASAWRDFR